MQKPLLLSSDGSCVTNQTWHKRNMLAVAVVNTMQGAHVAEQALNLE